MSCLHCDGWGCRRCLEFAGEQGASVDELREARLKARVAELEAEVERLKAALQKAQAQGVAALCDAERLRAERDEARAHASDLEHILLGEGAVESSANRRVAVAVRERDEAQTEVERLKGEAVLVPRAVLEQVKEALRKEMDPDLLKLPCVPGCQNPACLALAALEALGE